MSSVQPGTTVRTAPRLTYFPFVLLLSALAVGIVADRSWPAAAAVWCSAAVVSFALWLVLHLLRRDQAASWLLLASACATGGLWHHAYWRLYRADDIGRMVDELARPTCIEAMAITAPRWIPAPPPTPLRTVPQGEECELLVWVTAVRDGRTFRPASGWANLEIQGRVGGVRAGDRLRIMAQASRPHPPLNPGEFNFAALSRSRRIGCRLFAEFPPSLEVVAEGSALSPRRWLADLRAGGAALLSRYIAPERAPLAAAILLGAREQLDPHRNEGYLVTGTIHVLSISGLHVGILAAGFFFLLRTGLVPRQFALLATIVLTITYMLLTDVRPPVTRATILVVAACLALWSGRSHLGFNTLAAAGIVVLVLNPASLFQTGPQLSFLAVATIIACRPLLARQPIVDPLDRLIAATRPLAVRGIVRTRDFVWRVWLTGALIWLVSSPLVWKQFNLISPVALIVNFVMWLPVPLAMYAGMGTLLFGSISTLAGRACGLACDRSLAVLEGAIGWGRVLPASHFWLPAPPAWWVGLFYATAALLVALPALRPPRRWILALALMWAAGAFLLSGRAGIQPWRQGPRPLACHFVAVGHGVAVLVELPDGRNLLYDAGRLGFPLAGVRPISAVLWSRGVTHLDAVVISHADADHFNAIPELLRRFSVGVVYVSPVMFKRPPPAVQALQEAIRDSRVPLREMHAGRRLDGGPGVSIEVLHPPRRGVIGSNNANSVVLLIEHAGRRVLLTGDLEPPGLNDLLSEEPIDCDVVLAPHHGSPRSDPGGFADWSRPEYVVISGGRRLGNLATIEGVKHSLRLRGAEVLHTSEDGCVRVEISRAGLSVATFRPHVRASDVTLTSANLLQAE